ncbi:two-component system, OmpR family, heavy metal sensor histidine kinase CusS [Pseudomonas taetrolens]|uniref:Sensor protein n=1 Tax=Pseudomonas taetrolens TaxID=47884 RepID=A0A0J6GNT4_PSETA|nr:heavy metal sensor histidine kinase [Pseudomonas taetrolens]KMM83794.1 ATPase [Pseudomonas taetrolens]SEB91402.1 two-component system, OmpR family, heavy metal sensor histidine kinase CusS [Pseudomonas taetrolens]SQF85598.1 sensor protein CopS [Pseudomonas taetrolens]VEH48675.1 sensor protein CopS [Pseudomonas taetrolens]
MRRLSLSSRLALLFAGCTAVVSLFAGVLFGRASEVHFVELDQQLMESRLAVLRGTLQGADTLENFTGRLPALLQDLAHQPDLAVRVRGPDGHLWFDSSPRLPLELPSRPGLGSLQIDGIDYRVLNPVPDTQNAPRLTLLLDITHHQHFLQRMQHLIWMTVGLSALATAILGAWAARSGLQPLRRMSAIAGSVSADSLNARLPQAQMPAELADLAKAFNAMLERLDSSFQRLSAFSADIAHELRTPLSNLLTHTQVTLTRPRSLEEYREALHSNLEELQWMAQLVNDMLYLAKADHGLLTPRREPLELAREVDALLEFYAPLAEDSQIALSRTGNGQIAGDRSMLRRALSNLLDNALRYTPAGGTIRVLITATASHLRISLENTGTQIPAEQLPRLFDRFYRADPARREGSSEHAGLGLAITQSIIRAHGGQIGCESQEGLTRFVIELPPGQTP